MAEQEQTVFLIGASNDDCSAWNWWKIKAQTIEVTEAGGGEELAAKNGEEIVARIYAPRVSYINYSGYVIDPPSQPPQALRGH